MKITLKVLKNITTPVSLIVSNPRQARLLPSFLNDVTIGQLLGDAACMKSSPTSNSRLE